MVSVPVSSRAARFDFFVVGSAVRPVHVARVVCFGRCHRQPFKYTCPRCETLYCSAGCYRVRDRILGVWILLVAVYTELLKYTEARLRKVLGWSSLLVPTRKCDEANKQRALQEPG